MPCWVRSLAASLVGGLEETLKMLPMIFPMIPTLIGSVVGALASGPLGTTVLRGVLAGGLLGGAGSVAMQQRARGPVTLPTHLPAPLPVAPAAVLPDGQLVEPPSTPGELREQQKTEFEQAMKESREARNPCAHLDFGVYRFGMGPDGNCHKGSTLAWMRQNPGKDPMFAPIG
jgi:hypothetical protein